MKQDDPAVPRTVHWDPPTEPLSTTLCGTPGPRQICQAFVTCMKCRAHDTFKHFEVLVHVAHDGNEKAAYESIHSPIYKAYAIAARK